VPTRDPHVSLPAPGGPSGIVTIVVVDDHPVVRHGLIAILSDEPAFRVVGEASSGEETLRLVARSRPRVVVMDGRLPSLSPIEVCAALVTRQPDVRVILAVTFLDRTTITRAQSAGAHGVVLKDSEPATIRDSVRVVAGGGRFVDPRARPHRATGSARQPFGLTPRQLTVLQLLPRGLTNGAIGAELWISEDTVKTHVKAILAKLGARDRAEAAVIALREGLV
jgi:two-component system, NarL family, response regulator DevR